MKKTLIITLEYPPTIGGIATYVHDLADALDPEQTVVLAPHHVDEKAWDEAVPYKVIRKQLLFPKIIWPRWIKLCLLARKIVKQEGIELIMIQHALPAGYAGIFVKKFLKVPFLLFSHGTDLVAGTATKWKKRMITKVSEAAEQIIFNSESLKRRYLRVLPMFEEKSLVMYPCPEEDFLTPPEEAKIDELRGMYALKGKETILTVSRITDGKGFPHLVRMMPEILKRHPHLVWLIVGGGDKKQELMKLINEAKLQNVVRFIGEIPHKDLKTFYYLADLFVLLTHPDEGREEGLGLVFLEAAAAGLPTVAGKSGGVEEAVLHTQTGVVVDIYQGDPAVIDAIDTMMNEKEYAATLGKQAKDRIMADFRWEKQVQLLSPWIE